MTFDFYCIVEGHGEVSAVPVLLRRLRDELRPDVDLRVHQPHRVSRVKLLNPTSNELSRTLRIANTRIRASGAILILLDADDLLPCQAGPELLNRAIAVHPRQADVPLSVVFAMREFEAWFLAAYDSLIGIRRLIRAEGVAASAEAVRDAKGVLTHHMAGGISYSPTVDQPALAAKFDLKQARANAPSFAKLYRDIQRILSAL